MNPVAEILFNYLRDVIYNPSRAKLEIEQIPEDFRDLGEGLLYLVECVFETKEIAQALSRGELDGKQPSRGNELAAPLKSLQASLKHLTWQAEQVAKGDYRQHVDFMGSFSVAFNMMVEQLEQRRKGFVDENSRLSQYVNLLLSNTVDMILLFDTHEELVLASHSYLRQANAPSEEDIQGKRFDELFAPVATGAFLQSMKNLFCTALTDSRSSATEHEIDFEQNGASRFYRIMVTPMLDAQGATAGVMTVFTDSTAIIQAQREAERANRAKTDFLARMSHEMRTPMNAIMGMTTLCKTAEEPERRTYCLDRISEASASLLGVINDVLDMSNLETDKLELSPVEFNFEKMLRRVSESLSFRIVEQKQKFLMDWDKTIPTTLIVDEKRLSQVLSNLLSNAIKFTPERGVISLNVTIVAKKDEFCTLRFVVKDTGIGIAKELQRHMFLPFEQVDGGYARKFGGSGLGLAITKRLVEMMGGSIWVESEPDAGASFFFEINAQTVAKELSPAESDTGNAEETSPNTVDFTGKHLMIAEDVEINREIMQALLEDFGFEMTFACDGAEAVEKFASAEKPFDLILMDIHMPEMDGYEATRSIRASGLPTAKSIPIIAMTANVFQEDIDNCLACGMNDHLGKPVELDAVIANLQKYLT